MKNIILTTLLITFSFQLTYATDNDKNITERTENVASNNGVIPVKVLKTNSNNEAARLCGFWPKISDGIGGISGKYRNCTDGRQTISYKKF